MDRAVRRQHLVDSRPERDPRRRRRWALGIWLTRQLSTRRAAVLAGVLLALLPTAVRYSQEVRMYSLLGVWLLGATLALVYWVRQPERTRYMAVYVLLMSAGFYTHYFAALCVLVHWAYLGLSAAPVSA